MWKHAIRSSRGPAAFGIGTERPKSAGVKGNNEIRSKTTFLGLASRKTKKAGIPIPNRGASRPHSARPIAIGEGGTVRIISSPRQNASDTSRPREPGVMRNSSRGTRRARTAGHHRKLAKSGGRSTSQGRHRLLSASAAVSKHRDGPPRSLPSAGRSRKLKSATATSKRQHGQNKGVRRTAKENLERPKSGPALSRPTGVRRPNSSPSHMRSPGLVQSDSVKRITYYGAKVSLSQEKKRKLCLSSRKTLTLSSPSSYGE